MGNKTVRHCPYSPDLASCDFRLFTKLRGCHYETIKEMKEAVIKVIDMLTQEDFHGAFQKLLEWYKCIAAREDYFEGDLRFMCVLSIKVPIWKKSANLLYAPRSFILFPRVSAQSEMQTALFRFKLWSSIPLSTIITITIRILFNGISSVCFITLYFSLHGQAKNFSAQNVLIFIKQFCKQLNNILLTSDISNKQLKLISYHYKTHWWLCLSFNKLSRPISPWFVFC